MPSKRDIPYILLAIVVLFIVFFLIPAIILPPPHCLLPCEPKIIIEKANLSAKQGLLTLMVKNIGVMTTTISKIELLSAEQPGISQRGGTRLLCSLNTQTIQNPEVPPGASLTIQYDCNQELKAGTTYYIIVYYTKGDTIVPTDPYPVTAR